MDIPQKPELVCPAGDWASLQAVVHNGADSVYFGVKGLNMRHYAANFDPLELNKVMAFLHEHDKKGYLTLNTVIMNDDLPRVKKVLGLAREAGADAVILWDMAVFTAAKELGLRIHLSTQASVANFEALEAYARLGVKRVVLARECSLSDIQNIRQMSLSRGLECELECFVHGAMCVSVSGRCFLSSYSHGKSANKGQCIQPCRHEYIIKDTESDMEYVIGQDYILSPKDLCALDFIDELLKANINSFKVEGRIRSVEYLRVVTSVYREAVDAFFQGRLTPDLKARLKEDLSKVYNRGFSSGFYFGRPQEDVSRGLEHSYKKIYVGEVRRFFKKISVAEIHLGHHAIARGQELLFIGRSTPGLSAVIQEMQIEHQGVEQAAKGDFVAVKLPFSVKPKDKVFLWQEKE